MANDVEDIAAWATVERSDDPFSDTTLEVPELTSDLLDSLDDSEQRQQETSAQEPQRAEPGSTVECAICGRDVRVKRDGLLSKHKCEPKPARGNRTAHIPERRAVTPQRVRAFAIATIAAGVEEGSAHLLARPFGVDPDSVPTELPDAEGMIGPPVDLLWPSIPKAGQEFIAKLADNADLIDCALSWADWLRTLSRWTREQRAYQQRLAEQERQSGPTQFAATDGLVGRVVPFSPAQ